MEMHYEYKYAELNPTTKRCIGFQTSTAPIPEDELPSNWIVVDVDDPEYIGKYYINGQWYTDAAGTIPWSPAGKE